jgi:uncharacterized RDD family membrane protein YckC
MLTGESASVSTFSKPPGTFDDHAIDTPEQVALYFPLAGLGSRFLAAALDVAIQAAVSLLIVLVAVIVFSAIGTHKLDTMSNTAAKWFTALLILGYFILIWGYYALFEAFRNGQTPGKRVLKIRVIKDSGRQITFFEALARNLLRVIDSLPGAYLTGVISILMTKQNKRLGDLVAGTIVVHERTEEFGGYLYTPVSRSFTANLFDAPTTPPQVLSEIPADRIARLTYSDLHLIDSFLARAISLPMEARAQLGSRLLDALCRKMDVAVPTDVPPERTLEAFAYTLRGARRA